MKCLIDTNILISASLFPDSVPAAAFIKAVNHPHKAVVCDYSIDELRRVYNRKFPNKIAALEHFLSVFLLTVDIVPTPPEEESSEEETKIRDMNDRPILRAALATKVDVLVTGDRDFLESGVKKPKIVTAADFLRL
ncbi:putative toxin-antitoxin system toxin component, PIN family [Acetanaerobacterium elongatum]|uniref:Putative toxin-antitoxin system toxin component, PIN family n=1 Tax=Acetanaerobacterium elongatum TaxID=258515 RepID=A0A1H0E9I7_9FIRM|nr:putative toxin-antitoxin system toxin component, PIN family [Acetanaerobacterium elongatum]SDN79042.1 putative toxin-antitoxin system toxin component, PIN family [Acetanaerobacterium elongatum]